MQSNRKPSLAAGISKSKSKSTRHEYICHAELTCQNRGHGCIMSCRPIGAISLPIRRGEDFSLFFCVVFVSCSLFHLFFFGRFFVFSCFLSVRNKKSVVCYKIVRYNRENFQSWVSYMAKRSIRWGWYQSLREKRKSEKSWHHDQEIRYKYHGTSMAPDCRDRRALAQLHVRE